MRVAREAVHLRRVLLAEPLPPQAYADLARSLNNLANHLVRWVAW